MLKKTLATALLSAITATTIFAAPAQAETNPLHPSYYRERAASWIQAKASTDAARYVDVNNPLNPSFNRNGDANWIVTADLHVVPYLDIHNPLSPSYKR